MKTMPLLCSRTHVFATVFARQCKVALIVLAALVSLAGCKKDKEATPTPAVSFEGKFEIQEVDPKNNYTITFTKDASKSNTFQISNFGNYPNLTVVATVQNHELEIPYQTFTSGTKKLHVFGLGVLNGDMLNLYFKFTGYQQLERDVKAKKKL